MDIESLKTINEEKINYYMQLVKKNKCEENEKEFEIHTRIKKILDKDESIFFKISMEDALKVLSKLIPKDSLKSTYSDLISGKNFKDLRNRFKV